MEVAKQALKTLLDSKTTEVAKYSEAKYADIKTTLEAAYVAAEGKKDSTSKEELANAKTILEAAVQKATSDKTAKDIDEAKKALKAVLDKKIEELAKYTIADAKYSLDAVKEKLEQAFTAGQTAHNKQQTTVDELNSAKTTLENAITTAGTEKTEVETLYNNTRNALLSRFAKMYEYKELHGINVELFDKYNEASVEFYNQGNKLDKEKLQSIKSKIDDAVNKAEQAKGTANKLTTSTQNIHLIKFNEVNEASSNSTLEDAIDPSNTLSIPFYAGPNGNEAIKKASELKFNFSVPTTIKSVRLQQYTRGDSGKDEGIASITVYGYTEGNQWQEIGKITGEGESAQQLQKIENVKVDVPADKLSTKYKIITLKSDKDTGKWWGIRDVEIIDGSDKRIYIETPIVVSSFSYPRYYLDAKRLKYKNEAPENNTYKRENLFDNNLATFNIYRHGVGDTQKSLKNDTLYLEFLKPMNIHSLTLHQDAVLKLNNIKVTLITEDNKTVEKTFDNTDNKVLFQVAGDDLNKKYKQVKIENLSDSTSFWQLNEIEIL
ncbi:hypothetical protein [Mycoplasma nasistruthionis]|uniref:Uncharacterized protein n=1 Tax=Mycoplasma nasistruthionis TaxID=353852 RepID=A0A5B7XWQ8_9MOLU|nr:hypothetical protein [Mycoplasma nasistruthionis]QCZ36955.1 hypothetical protein FG904_03020 [Mycoplasma nasistruthionis]